MRKIVLIVFVIISIRIDLFQALSSHYSIIDLENDLIYQRIQTLRDLERFYRKLTDGVEYNHRNNSQCFRSSSDLLNALEIQSNRINGSLTREEIQRILPALFHAKFNEECRKSHGRTSWKNILIGFLAVSFINCSGLGGVILLPFRKKPTFKWILIGFIGLAVGSLTGSGIFHLIPMAFNIPNVDIYHHCLYKTLLTMIAIYLFYIRDQLSKIFFNIETIIYPHIPEKEKFTRSTSLPSLITRRSNLKKENLTNLIENLKIMKAVGWMIFLGDILHNFINGLTLGAAFTVSIGEGLRMSFPIACEEFPYELGDIAMLLSSGLTIGQALIVNFLAACSCYVGYFLGVKLGEFEEFHSWIYALAGGMFVYIGLADMIPEMISIGDEIERDYLESKQSVTKFVKLKIFICQNSGVILGVSLMFLLARYGGYLENFQMKM